MTTLCPSCGCEVIRHSIFKPYKCDVCTNCVGWPSDPRFEQPVFVRGIVIGIVKGHRKEI